MGAFGLGFVQGLATSTDDALKTHIKDNKDRFNKNLEAALSRNLERSTRYDKKSREAQEALDLVAGLTGGDLGRASEIIQGIGGVSQTQGFIDKFRARQAVDKDLKFADVVTFAKEQQGILTPQQSIDQVLTPYSFTTPPQEPKKKGLFSFLDDPRSMAVQAKKEWLARGNTIREAGNIIKRQGAQINYSKLATPEQMTALKKSTLEMTALEQQNTARETAIDVANLQHSWMTDDHARDIQKFGADMAGANATTQTRIQALKTAREYDAPKAQAAIDASISASIASRSSKDLVEQYNLLGTEERYYNDQLSQQEEGSDKYMQTARRLTNVRLAKTRIHADRLSTVGDDTFTNVSVVGAANAIKADAMRDAGLKFKQGLNGQIEMLKKGSSDKIYQAANNGYKNFAKSFGQSSAPQVTQQLEAMKQSMLNAKDTYISEAVQLFYKGASKTETSDAIAPQLTATMPKTHSKEGVPNISLLRKLPPGTVVLINSQESLKYTYNKFGEAGNFGIWDGGRVIQRQKYNTGEPAPSYRPDFTDKDYVK